MCFLKRALLLVCIVCGFGVCSAIEVNSDCPDPQGDKAKREQMFQEMLEFKINYLAQEMNLSGASRKKFASLYTKMTREKGKVWREMHDVDIKMKSKNLSDEDAFNCINAMNDLRDQESAIDRKYDDKFASFLSPKEIIKMHQAEKNFRHKLRSMRSGERPSRRNTENRGRPHRQQRPDKEPTLIMIQ